MGRDTALAQIVQLVEAAQMSKAPIQAFADYVSSIFVPIVVVLAAITTCCWCAGCWSVSPEACCACVEGPGPQTCGRCWG